LGRVVADATCTPFQSSTFDLIVCRQGLHYLDEGAAASELSRLRPKEIRLGQIVAPNEDSADWWSDLFKTLAPGRKRVYMPSDLEKFVDKLVGTWAVNIIKFSLADSFSQNFKHLQDRNKTIAETMVRDMPREIASAMDFDGDVYRQDWEVIIASAID
ncbi:MAG: class I SAM-dependent methyltransferase, partial [Candidatus Thiodiazotropha endolucinida]